MKGGMREACGNNKESDGGAMGYTLELHVGEVMNMAS